MYVNVQEAAGGWMEEGAERVSKPHGRAGLGWQYKALTLDPSPLHHLWPSADPGKWTAAVTPPPLLFLPLTHTQTHTRPLTALNLPGPTSTLFFSPILFHISLPPVLHCSFPSHASLHHSAHLNIPAPNLSHYFEMCRHLQQSHLCRKREYMFLCVFVFWLS